MDLIKVTQYLPALRRSDKANLPAIKNRFTESHDKEEPYEAGSKAWLYAKFIGFALAPSAYAIVWGIKGVGKIEQGIRKIPYGAVGALSIVMGFVAADNLSTAGGKTHDLTQTIGSAFPRVLRAALNYERNAFEFISWASYGPEGLAYLLTPASVDPEIKKYIGPIYNGTNKVAMPIAEMFDRSSNYFTDIIERSQKTTILAVEVPSNSKPTSAAAVLTAAHQASKASEDACAADKNSLTNRIQALTLSNDAYMAENRIVREYFERLIQYFDQGNPTCDNFAKLRQIVGEMKEKLVPTPKKVVPVASKKGGNPKVISVSSKSKTAS